MTNYIKNINITCYNMNFTVCLPNNVFYLYHPVLSLQSAEYAKCFQDLGNNFVTFIY